MHSDNNELVQRHTLDYFLSILPDPFLIGTGLDRLYLNLGIFPLAFIVKDKGSLTRVQYPKLYNFSSL